MGWKQAQLAESSWWGDCLNTFQEESKQRAYAERMGLCEDSVNGKWPVYSIEGKSVVDIGGGPTSILLKCIDRGRCMVVDPCYYPDWVGQRYRAGNIHLLRMRGEEFDGRGWHEAWIYNTLQHVEDPEAVIRNAFKMAPVVRLCEWIDVPADGLHLTTLKTDDLRRWLGPGGREERMPMFGASAYYGVFSRPAQREARPFPTRAADPVLVRR